MYRNDKVPSIGSRIIAAERRRTGSDVPLPVNVKVLGLCLGASTVSLVQLESDGDRSRPRVSAFSLHAHEGAPRQTLLAALEPLDLSSFDKIVVTGRRFRKLVHLTGISEPEAIEYAYRFVVPPQVSCPAIVSAGGETTMVYVLNRRGRIANVITGNKCASGTGEFFLQQIRRMNVSLDTAAKWSLSRNPYRVSGRCSVFCKSDCTHATNKGVAKSRVVAGLCRMMADKIMELLKKVKRQDVMIVGGTTRNHMMIAYLRREISGLFIPKEASYFEALGAALWGLEHRTRPFPGKSYLFNSDIRSFNAHPPLRDFEELVTFKSMTPQEIRANDECLLGLDVGSTTTKAVLMRYADNAILSSVYLRTNGDPVGASRNCYQRLLAQIERHTDPTGITISGLGVCGSGRQIAGLHAMSDGVINEIIAHATAAVYFDDGVDTIFEIGGQDAKYTYITNSVPSDYAMNEACSAGTGSFLEESAYETLGVKMEAIADIALKGESPPNFNDQCAAFIASDIKNAIHEGIGSSDIIAGLVYSICMNYTNRVKGNRPMGKKIFMQGGVCYNRAVPLAMAALVGKPIVVPPEPGLMGAYGVALEVKKRIEMGLMTKKPYDLKGLADREVIYRKPFVCKGGKQKCDRHCDIAVVEIENRKYPFGGACNRYYNLRHHIRFDTEALDLVTKRQRLIYDATDDRQRIKARHAGQKTVGINRSFMVNTYYPLYAGFFRELGVEPIVPREVSQQGIDRKNAPFCFPAELAHGFFYRLIHTDPPPDYLFLPHFRAIPNQGDADASQVCPFVQGETYYLRSTFKRRLEKLQHNGMKILSPVIDLSGGLSDARAPLVEAALNIGAGRQAAEDAFATALAEQEGCLEQMKSIGAATLAELERDPQKIAIVIFARPYNGFVSEAHMGIPGKLASRGAMVLPLDFLPLEAEHSKSHMYWGMGQLILKAARFVKKHPQLFGTYITNFSCGPDSFLVGYVREVMGRKPCLTLELDSHTADAGIETRIEAFLDIVHSYRRLLRARQIHTVPQSVAPARTSLEDGVPAVITSAGEVVPMTDERVTILIPSMGRISSEALGAVFKGRGYRVFVHPPSDENVLKLGRANTSCKECLPLILTTGMLLNYIRHIKKADDILVYFMPTGSGPCRFGQYSIFMQDLIARLEVPDVAIFALTSEKSYVGLGAGFQQIGLWAVIVSDVMEDIRSMILANAVEVPTALAVFDTEWEAIKQGLESGRFDVLCDCLAQSADRLARIETRRPFSAVPRILLTGEIFVRRDALSRQFLSERLAQSGMATVCSPIAEWLYYSDYLRDRGIVNQGMSTWEKIEFLIKKKTMIANEKRIKTILSRSGLIRPEAVHIDTVIKNAEGHISPQLTGEAILTIGSAISEVVSNTCGVIAIGPFGCMPNRLSEAILSDVMCREYKLAAHPVDKRIEGILDDVDDLPFLAIESDGQLFPQLINAKLEAFCLQAERLHERMQI